MISLEDVQIKTNGKSFIQMGQFINGYIIAKYREVQAIQNPHGRI